MHVILCWEKDPERAPHFRVLEGTTWHPGGKPRPTLCRPTQNVWVCDDVRGLTPTLEAALCPECKALAEIFKPTQNRPEPFYAPHEPRPKPPYVRPKRGELSYTARRVLEVIQARPEGVLANYTYRHPDGRDVAVTRRQAAYLLRLGRIQEAFVGSYCVLVAK